MAGSPHKRVVPPDDDDEEEEVEAMDAVIGEDEDDNGDDDGEPTTHFDSHSVLLADHSSSLGIMSVVFDRKKCLFFMNSLIKLVNSLSSLP